MKALDLKKTISFFFSIVISIKTLICLSSLKKSVFTVKKLWPLSTIALLMVVLPKLSLTYQHNGLIALYLFWAVDKLGILDELVTLVLMHETLWQVVGKMPSISQLMACLQTHDIRDECQ